MPIHQATIRASALAGFREFLSARGINLDDLLPEVGLERATLEDRDALIPLDSVALLMEVAAQAANDPCLGVRYAEAYPKGGSGVLGYLVLNARTVREALESLARYLEIFVHPVQMRFREEGGLAVLSWRLPLNGSVPREQFSSFGIAIIILRLRQLVGQDWRPRRVELAHRKLPCSQEISRLVGSRIRYNHGVNAIVVDGASLVRRTQHSDPQLYPILRLAGEAKLRELEESSDIVVRTFRAIADNLSGAPPFLDQVAQQLHITPRSLQHRLAREGTNFGKVLSETRQSLAERYLRETDLPMTEIAFLLGFSELSAFTRAARGWFGAPPRRVRLERRRSGPARIG